MNAPRRVLLTGASGWIGRAVLEAGLRRPGIAWRVLARRPLAVPAGVECRLHGFAPDADWRDAVAGADAVVHLAAAHRAGLPPAAYRRVNVEVTAALARAAAAAGVRRFLLVSSIKAMGETSPPGRPWRPEDPPRPESAYGRSKLAGEVVVRAAAGPMDVVIVRPPLVYGPGVGGLFGRLLAWLDAGRPLPPSGALRSFIALPNLVDLLLHLLDAPAAAGRVFLAADAPPAPLARWLAALARRLGRRPRFCRAVPRAALETLAPGFARRWWGTLAVDPRPLRAALDWRPPLSRGAALDATVAAHRAGRRA